MPIEIRLKQHIGPPCKPIVALGERVQRGSLIACPQGLGANIFSSVNGRIVDISKDAISILPDEEQGEGYLPIPSEVGSDLLELVRYAGVVGMGGAGFPTAVKLEADLREGVLLINAAECEPGLRHNIAFIEKEPEKLLGGIAYAMEITKAPKAIIAIKEKHKRAVALLEKLLEDKPCVHLQLLPDLYPMGEERAIVYQCLGIELAPHELPLAAKAVVLNVETLKRIYEAIAERKPCFSKDITVCGQLQGHREGQVFLDVPTGTALETLLQQAGGIENKPYGELVIGGAFTGREGALTEPITKTTGGIMVSAEFPDLHGAPVGILVCACSASEERMRKLVERMNGKAVFLAYCKQAIETKPGGPLKCQRPGRCPGQVQNNLLFKEAGCEYVLMGNCSDCSNTVMASAPKLGLKVYHVTDHVMRAIGHPLYRRLKESKA